MIKIIISLTKIVIGLVIALVVSSCRFTGVSGDGNVTTNTRDVGADFTGVEAKRGIEVLILQSDTHSVTVEADSNLHQYIVTTVDNGILTVTSDESIANAEVLKVTVKMPVINKLSTAAGSSIKSGNVLTSDLMNISASSGSELRVEIESDKVISEASSGSTVDLRGKALSLEISSSSGSTVDARKLLTNVITAQANSGSSIDVHPIVSLDAKASSGSSIDYHSIPKKITVKANSGGSVSQQ